MSKVEVTGTRNLKAERRITRKAFVGNRGMIKMSIVRKINDPVCA